MVRVASLVFLFLAIFFSACLGISGNGEGVGARPNTGPASGAAGGMYYNMDPSAVCANAAGSKVYRWAITFHPDGTISLTDNCSGTSEGLAGSQIDHSSLWPIVGYQAAIYEFRPGIPVPGDPKGNYAETFCLSASGSDDAEAIVRAGPGSPTREASVGLKGSSGWGLFNGQVQVNEEHSEITYQANQFTLTVNVGSTSLAPYRYPGALSIQGVTAGVDMSCRLVKPKSELE